MKAYSFQPPYISNPFPKASERRVSRSDPNQGPPFSGFLIFPPSDDGNCSDSTGIFFPSALVFFFLGEPFSSSIKKQVSV